MSINNYKSFTKKGTPLEKFINTYQDNLKGKRGFYILSFKMDEEKGKDILFKIGVAHRTIYGRLRSYVVSYGESDSKCNGVFIHYLGTTNYNQNVETKNSAIAKLEVKMINALQKYKVPRGKERFRLDPDTLKKTLSKFVNKGYEPKPVKNTYNLKSKGKVKK